MSEKEMDRAWYAAAKCQHVPVGACLTCIGASLAAAEERGRRGQNDLLRDVRAWIADFPFSTSAGRDTPWMLERIDAALAPRDSGKDG